MQEVTLTTRTIFVLFRAIPLGMRKTLFKAFFLLFYHFSEKNRLIVLHNLVRAFPEKSLPELKRIAKDSYRHLGIVAAEFFDILSLTMDNILDWFVPEGLEHYVKAYAQNKGILLFTGHFGNWEIMAAACAVIFDPVHIVYRELDNPFMRNIVDRVRSYTGNKLIPKGGAARKIIRLLGKKQSIGILIDQNVSWKEGVFIDFFGRSAATTSGLAAIALQTGAPVLPAFAYRIPSGKYKVVLGPVLEMSETGDYERDIYENTKRFTNILEEHVRRHPEQWFWLHQRWKTKKTQIVNKTKKRASRP